MQLEAHGLSEPLAADVAAVRFLPRVNIHVYLEIAGVAELFITQVAGVRLLPRVNAHVVLQFDRADECFAADIAHRLPWFLPRVDPHVVHERAGVAAAFPAGLADIRFVPSVC